MATAISCNREHLHGSPREVLVAMSVSILSERDSQARPLGQGVCDTEYEYGQAIGVHAPLVVGAIHLLNWVSNPNIVQNYARPKKLLYTSIRIHWCCRHSSLATAKAFQATFEVPLLRRKCPPCRSPCRSWKYPPQSWTLPSTCIHPSGANGARLAGSQGVCRAGTRMSRSTKISASILVGAIGWLVAVGELLALSLSCERLQTGDVFVRLVTAMVAMAVLSA
jgi:hypothetical protein